MRDVVISILAMTGISCSHVPQKTEEMMTERKPSRTQENESWNDCFSLYASGNNQTFLLERHMVRDGPVYETVRAQHWRD